MGIALVIVAGLVVITAITMLGDYFTKSKLARSSVDAKKVLEMEGRIEALEKAAAEQDRKLRQLESDVSFTNKLLEDKTR